MIKRERKRERESAIGFHCFRFSSICTVCVKWLLLCLVAHENTAVCCIRSVGMYVKLRVCFLLFISRDNRHSLSHRCERVSVVWACVCIRNLSQFFSFGVPFHWYLCGKSSSSSCYSKAPRVCMCLGLFVRMVSMQVDINTWIESDKRNNMNSIDAQTLLLWCFQSKREWKYCTFVCVCVCVAVLLCHCLHWIQAKSLFNASQHT